MPKKKYINKTCKKHGLTEYVLESRGYYRCKTCRVEQVTKSRRNRKLKLVKHFGGKCKICGYDKCPNALHFHHSDPEKKSFGISEKGVTISFKSAKLEAEKCILVCANCHAELHYQQENTEPSPKGKV